MTLPPRAVLVHRRTDLQELLARHGTRGQAEFFLRTRGRRIEDADARHHAVNHAISTVSAAIPARWRRAIVERAELPRFLFEPGDIIVVAGQDGLVANLAKYLDGQVVIGINAEPGRNPGVLVPHPPEAAQALLTTAAGPGVAGHVENLAMVQASTDDGQRLTALNEIYIGQPSHQTARYAITLPDGRTERQASSGLIASTGTACTEGDLTAGQTLSLTAESDQLVLFGDGIEADAIPVNWGQAARITVAGQTVRMLR